MADLTHEALARDVRALLRQYLKLMEIDATVATDVEARRILFPICMAAHELRRFTGDGGERWRALRSLMEVLEGLHGIPLTITLIDPPGSTWAFAVRAAGHHLQVASVRSPKGGAQTLGARVALA